MFFLPKYGIYFQATFIPPQERNLKKSPSTTQSKPYPVLLSIRDLNEFAYVMGEWGALELLNAKTTGFTGYQR